MTLTESYSCVTQAVCDLSDSSFAGAQYRAAVAAVGVAAWDAGATASAPGSVERQQLTRSIGVASVMLLEHGLAAVQAFCGLALAA